MTAETVQAQELAAQIEQTWGEEVSAMRGSFKPVVNVRPYVYASSFHKCARAMVYSMTHHHELPQFEPDVLARMERGNEIERDRLLFLARVGQRMDPPFRVIAQQERFELKDRKGRVVIVGKVDARLEFSRNVSCPVEFKTWSPFLVDKIHTFPDVFKSYWTRKGAYQNLCYLYGSSESLGFLMLDRAGIPKIIPVELDQYWDQVEEYLARAEVAMDHKEAGTLPDYLNDPAECSRCDWYGGTCNPPLAASDSMLKILNDPETESMLARREELKDLASEYTAIDKAVKKRLANIEHGISGKFLIEGQEIEKKAFSVKESKYWRVDITKL